MSDFDDADIIAPVNASSDFDEADIITEAPKVSQVQSLLKGAEQGLTFGSADEIQGGQSSLMDLGQAGLHNLASLIGQPDLIPPSPSQADEALVKQGFTGDLKPSTLDQYRSTRDSARQEYDAAQKANPGTYLAGNIGGGALTLPFLPGMGTAGQGASALAKAGSAMKAAALPSAAVGLGMSDADLTRGEIMPAIKDVAVDTGIGMATAGALPLAGAAVKSAGNAIGKTQTMQDILESYRVGKEGLNMSSPEFLVKARDVLKDKATQADDAIRGKLKDVFGTKKAKLNELEASGIKSDTKELLQGLADKVNGTNALRDEEAQMLNKVLEKQIGQKGYLRSPVELENLLKDLQDLKANVQTPSGRQAVDAAVKQAKDLQNQLSTDLQKMNQEAFQLVEQGELLTGKNPLDYLTSKADQNVKEKLANTLENSTVANYKGQSFLDDILNGGTQTSKNVEIAPLNDLVPDAAKAMNEAKTVANRMRIAKDVQTQPFKGDNFLGATVNTALNASANVSNKVGLGVAQSQALLTKGIDKLSKADGNQLQQLSNRMIQIGGKSAEQFANVLNGIQNKSQVSKNAILFGLMQQPNFRELFHKANQGEFGDDVE